MQAKSLPRAPRHSAIWVALILWIASNGFVSIVARIATWEQLATYSGVASLCRWDCGLFGRVISTGYEKVPAPDGGGSWPFHPLFPFTAYPLYKWLKLPLFDSLVLTSKIELLVAIYVFLLFTRDECESLTDVVLAGSLLAFNPYVIYGHAGYSEPLYFSLLTLAFYFASRKRWIAAGVCGGLVSVTRVVGLLFSASYLTEWLRDTKWRPSWRDSKRILGLALCPLGAAIFMLYLHRRTGDALAHVHSQIGWGRAPASPLHYLLLSWNQHHWLRVWAVMAVVSFIAALYLFKIRRPELGLYLALVTLIAFSGGYLGVARYIWWQPPFLYAIYHLLRRHREWWPIYTAFAAGMAAFMIVGWFTGHVFVI